MSSERSPQVTAAAATSASLDILSERLRLRLFQAGDLPAFVAYRSDPDVARLVEVDRFKEEWCTLRIYALLRREWELSRHGMRHEEPRSAAPAPGTPELHS